MKHIAVLVGSLRKGSYARKIANNILDMFPKDYEAKIVEIRDLPLYDADYDNPEETDKPLPESYTEFRNTIKAADGVLFVTPENNRCIPACLKNAVDVASKPAGDVAWKGTPCGMMSHSVGAMGGYSAQKNLRLALSYFDMPLMGQPEVFLGKSPSLLDENGRIAVESTYKFLQSYVDKFVALVEANPRH